MARHPHRRHLILAWAGGLVILACAAILWLGGRAQQRQAWTGPLEGQGLLPSPAVTVAPTATWRGPVVVPSAEAQDNGGVTAETPGERLVAGSSPFEAFVGYANVADGSGGDGTLRRVAVPILMYHYISTPPADADIYRQDLSVTPTRFHAQMAYLAAHGYHVISLYDLNLALRWGAPLPPNPVILTFDDGYRDAYTEAFPILQEFGYTATFFVITTRLDEGHPAYLSWSQAQEMIRAGMSIESHTKDHVDLRSRDQSFLAYQVLGSIESIEAHTGRRPQFFCFPAGHWDEGVLDVVRASGLWAAVTTEGGVDHTTDENLLLPRVRISGDTDLATFGVLLRWEWDRPVS